YSSNYPAVVNVAAEKRDVARSIAAEAQRMAQTVRSEYTLAKSHAGAMEQAMREATGQGGLDSEAGIHLRELERSAAVNKSLFEDFLQKAKITGEQSTFQARDDRIVMPAHEGWQSFHDIRRVLMTSLMVGLGLGIGGAFLIEMLNHGFTNPRQVEDLLGVPVLASVPRIEGSKKERKGAILPIPLYQVEDRLSPFS